MRPSTSFEGRKKRKTMSTEKHTFILNAKWMGDSDAEGRLTLTDGNSVVFGVPAQLGGAPDRSSPEELLLSALAACYSITLAMLIEKKRYPAQIFDVRTEGVVERQPDRSLKFTQIIIRPTLELPTGDERKRGVLTDLAHKAEQHCLISRTLRGNVELIIEPIIVSSVVVPSD